MGCPGKGIHPPHGIGVGTWRDYQRQHCLGTVEVHQGDGTFLTARCSLSDAWTKAIVGPIHPALLAQLVDRHRADCTNRSPR